MIATARRAAPPTGSYDRPDTMRDAVCRQPGADPEWWTGDSMPVLANGVRGCRRCPALAACEQRQAADPQPGVYAAVLWAHAGVGQPARVSAMQPRHTQAVGPARYCEVCAQELTNRRKTRYCSQVCYRLARRDVRNPNITGRTCKMCAARFVGYYPRLYCSLACRRAGVRAGRRPPVEATP